MRSNQLLSAADCSGFSTPGPGSADRQFVAYPPGWTLRHANGVNNQWLIIGNGTLSGSVRGYVLVPRVPGK